MPPVPPASRSSRTDPHGWVLVLPDQLHPEAGPLSGGVRGRRVVLVESREWLSRRPYHVQRVALILLNQRAFADELRAAGAEVRELRTEGPMLDALRAFAAEHGPLEAAEPAEREVRAELSPLVADGALAWVPNRTWLSSDEDFRAARTTAGGFRMDAFYRALRHRTGILMEPDGSFAGGRLSFDTENRERWDGIPAAPEPPRFAMDGRRRDVAREIAERYAAHPGRLDLETLPATRADAERLWTWAVRHCLPHFGPYEDAISTRSTGLFHTRISPALNLSRILPRELVEGALASGAPIQSVEGFVRQVLGWREFVRHVHAATDGFRQGARTAGAPGDAGFAAWAGRAWQPVAAAPAGVDGGGCPSHLGAATPLPPAYWGKASGLRCLDTVVASVWDEAWSHHITRLMVLGNIASLLDVDPRALTDWFWVAYMDAWDWVVEPNVLGMATFAAGGVMTTKPYVAGAAYIDRMGDCCEGCAFTPGRTCPLTRLYWAFLARHEPVLRTNPRMAQVLASLRRRAPEERSRDSDTFVHVRDVLVRGERLEPSPTFMRPSR